MSSRTVSRDDLYKDVWSRPINQIALDLGVKHHAVKTACERLNIPTPPPGHWTKVTLSKKVEVSALPELKRGIDAYFDFLPYILANLNTSSTQSIKPITRKLHPVVKKNQAFFKDFTVLDRGIVRPKNADSFAVSVTKASIKRSLIIMNSLLWEFDKNSWLLQSHNGKHVLMTVLVEGEKIDFSLKERTKRVEHVLTASEQSKQARGEYVWHARYDFLPTGELTLAIESGFGYGNRNTFKDRKTLRVEGQIELFLEQLKPIAKSIKDGRVKERIRESRRLEQVEKRHLLKGLRDAELKKRGVLVKESEDWQKAKLIRAYVQSNQLKTDVEWTKWALNYADLLDPTTQGNDTVVEETMDMNLDHYY